MTANPSQPTPGEPMGITERQANDALRKLLSYAVREAARLRPSRVIAVRKAAEVLSNVIRDGVYRDD